MNHEFFDVQLLSERKHKKNKKQKQILLNGYKSANFTINKCDNIRESSIKYVSLYQEDSTLNALIANVGVKKII